MIGKLKFGLVVGFFLVAGTAGWQVGKSELANVELQDDMRDMASRLGTRTGYSAPKSDDDYRDAVVRIANGYGIVLDPEQVTVQRSGDNASESITLAVDYTVNIHIPGLAFQLHFTPTSERS